MAKTVKAVGKHRGAAGNGTRVRSTRKASQKTKKEEAKAPTANDLMLKAWKRMYETRHDRLL
jgi:hypothetical protein